MSWCIDCRTPIKGKLPRCPVCEQNRLLGEAQKRAERAERANQPVVANTSTWETFDFGLGGLFNWLFSAIFTLASYAGIIYLWGCFTWWVLRLMPAMIFGVFGSWPGWPAWVWIGF